MFDHEKLGVYRVSIVAMLTKMVSRQMQVREGSEYEYACEYEYDVAVP